MVSPLPCPPCLVLLAETMVVDLIYAAPLPVRDWECNFHAPFQPCCLRRHIGHSNTLARVLRASYVLPSHHLFPTFSVRAARSTGRDSVRFGSSEVISRYFSAPTALGITYSGFFGEAGTVSTTASPERQAVFHRRHAPLRVIWSCTFYRASRLTKKPTRTCGEGLICG